MSSSNRNKFAELIKFDKAEFSILACVETSARSWEDKFGNSTALPLKGCDFKGEKQV